VSGVRRLRIDGRFRSVHHAEELGNYVRTDCTFRPKQEVYGELGYGFWNKDCEREGEVASQGRGEKGGQKENEGVIRKNGGD
jgi:hypothetical protein